MWAASVVAVGLAVLASAVLAPAAVLDEVAVAVVTATSLAAVPGPGGALTLTVGVSASAEPVAGSVTVRDGDRPIAVLPLVGGAASVTTTALAGHHVVTAEFTGNGVLAGSVSAPVTVGEPAEVRGTVAVTIPAGSLTLTTERGPCGNRHIRATDTRAGNLGFVVNATVVGRAGSGPTVRVGTVVVQVPGNGLRAADVREPPGRSVLRPGVPRAMATYPPASGRARSISSGMSSAVPGALISRSGSSGR